MDLDDEIVLATIRAELRENPELMATRFALIIGASQLAKQHDVRLFRGERY